jgi:glycosyltransferase involved in cell wall biosynthesis
MKILFVSPYLPSRRAGSPVRLRGLMTNLAKSHSLSIVSLVRPAEDPALLDEVRSYCDLAVTIPNERFGLTGARKRAFQLRTALSTRSSFHAVHHRADFQAALDQVLERNSYDLIQVENCFMTQYRFPRELPVVVDEHNVDYEILTRTAAVVTAQPRRAFNQLDALKLRAEEERSWRTADACAVTSPHDEELVRQAAPHTRVAVVPNAVDTEFFTPRATTSEPTTVLFFGTLSYYPNTDGLLSFVRTVMPILRRSHPAIRLLVVGREPPPALVRYASPDITVTGEVDDVRPYLERARVVIAPLRIGGGTRLKILEAMAVGKPVVSTRIGAEGIAVTDQRDILLADEPDAFAAQVGRVLDDDDLARRLGDAARRLVETEYEWGASARKLEALQRSALQARLGRALRPESVTSTVSAPR